MSKRTPCSFYSKPGGCRKGNTCTFAHNRPGTANTHNPCGNKPFSPSKGAPAGVCNFYWDSGKCKREFGCKFRHERPASNRSGPSIAAVETVSPFLSESGMAKISGSGSDAIPLFNTLGLDPSTTHNHIRVFLRDDFRFRTPQQMCSFASLLLNASASNKSWSNEEGQIFMGVIASTSGNGLLRLGDVISFSNVSIKNKPGSLSFQKGFLPILHYLSSEYVVKSPLGHLVNALYGQLHNNLDHVVEVLRTCIKDSMDSKSFGDPSKRTDKVSGSAIFLTLAIVLFEYLTRYKNAASTHEPLASFVTQLSESLEVWVGGISTVPPSFEDEIALEDSDRRAFVVNSLREKLRSVMNIVEREQRLVAKPASGSNGSTSNSVAVSEAFLSVLRAHYEGPGESRAGGPRHDNDFVDFRKIEVCPTDEELSSMLAPFLPANIPNGPHHFPNDSMERLLDIQFRLLREELLAPLRQSVQLLLADLDAPRSARINAHGTQLDNLRRSRGGRYRYEDKRNSIMFNVYTGVHVDGLACDSRRGMVVGLRMDAPPGTARGRTAGARAAFWKAGSGKKLMQGGLIAVLWKKGNGVQVHLGLVASSADDLAESARRDRETLVLKTQFFDPAANFAFLEAKQNSAAQEMVLVESPVMFESIRPFLEALKREPESFPFKKYLVHPNSGTIQDVLIDPPRYATVPNFSFALDCLVRREDGEESLFLRATDASAVGAMRSQLKARSRLDESQVDALVDCLTREVALIQGPPGTGKTFIGIELIRVLVNSRALPIVLIAFTNHALDHMLGAVLDAGITKKIVRLGGRSADEKIQKFSLGELERMAPRSRFALSFASERKKLKEIEAKMTSMLKRFLDSKVPSHTMNEYMSIHYPDFNSSINNPPPWISTVYQLRLQQNHSEETWKTVDHGKSIDMDSTLYSFWRSGEDLDFLCVPVKAKAQKNQSANRFEVLASARPQGKGKVVESTVDADTNFETESNSESDDDDDDDDDVPVEERYMKMVHYEEEAGSDEPENATGVPQLELARPQETSDDEVFSESSSDVLNLSDLNDVPGFFAHFGEEVPSIPVSNRDLGDLLDDVLCDVWRLSREERDNLHRFWIKECKEQYYQSRKDEFRRLSDEHASLRERERARDDEIRLGIMSTADVIGCTTTGAAKLTALLKGIGPRVMIVEEAGQVLESHILANLIGSTQHLILIGDPLQLRPTLNNYGLSMDNSEGQKLYRFDMSLMERLSSTGLAMSRLDVQRRMRPMVSSLIRNTLYKGLCDHEIVKVYPDVRGFAKNVFFFDHNHKETGGGDDSISKHNTFEVAMIRDLVKYLLRQGTYSAEGGVVVLCGYLGQLAKVRDALSSEVVVLIDERDQKELADRENDTEVEQESATISRVPINKRVRIRTVDNYQGEEADVVILSLVRNSGGAQVGLDGRGSANIGFFKSENRTNVAVSRAKHGLFILGNANDFSSRSKMWSTIIDDLRDQDAVGDAFPIRCFRHPDQTTYVSKPGQLELFAPDGGCLFPCDFRLQCGHSCPFKCHSDDEKHINVLCNQPCTRQCSRGHPCKKECAEACGKCKEKVRSVRLPCGHMADHVFCHELDELSKVYCRTQIRRDLPTCEHKPTLDCGFDISNYRCSSICGGKMTCCQNDCKSKCFDCQQLNGARRPELQDEGGDGELVPQVVQRAMHQVHRCKRTLNCGHQCSMDCSSDHVQSGCNMPCKEKCRQQCKHSKCKSRCSDPCAPCKERCTWSCPHFECPVPCGSICVRLPCDKPCTRKLKCGHPCPSVCGEECEDQMCLTAGCAATKQEELDKIADFIMQRSLRELDPGNGTVDDMTITLKGCGHTFTVETLDGHCQMKDFYEQDAEGKWLHLKDLAPDFMKPPSCPTCRSPITSSRYGRVMKRAHLDILEANVASNTGRAVNQAHQWHDALDATQIETRLKSLISLVTPGNVKTSKKDLKSRRSNQEGILNRNDLWSVSWESISPGNPEFHGVSAEEAKVWNKEVAGLKRIYTAAADIASMRSAHRNAWESSFNFLYREEMDKATRDISRAPRKPEEHAMRVAKMKIGQPKPLADRRFCVEAFWISLNVRFTLIKFARLWLELRRTRPNYMAKSGGLWRDYIGFLLKSCKRDAQVALCEAEASQSRRQISTSKMFVMLFALESFKFGFQMRRILGPLSVDERTAFRDRAQECFSEARAMFREEVLKHSNANGEDAEAFKVTFQQPTANILKEWNTLEKSVMDESFVEPLSSEEKLQVITAMKREFYNVAGHFYRCPNGHLYTIGDCGGATVTSRCPECGAAIGGSGHQLLQTNQRDLEYERIAREQGGYGQSPFPWNQFRD
ncbi:P-loop containing nucleoside triphosphate hydrolase protein [Schizopora paradoxa]|uniref:p-loop containing nucleoside triphosphate hydrolase protein n=1 Tax=Schizopora paradoxa TaxID=27342 RepID=A0A0H2RRK3_9AGAM|nr:P-loop containing nucleoside triphosphate hydrolase protein [Schizopora paradoxa]